MDRLRTETVSARRRYQTAFFALGWLLAIGIVFHFTATNVLHRAFASVEDRLLRLGQRMSDAEGTAWEHTRHSSRHDEIHAALPRLQSRDWILHPDRTLFGVYDGGLPESFRGIDNLETHLHYRFPIISIYQAWGDHPDEARFPLRAVATIDRLGSLPMVTWEPWVKDFDDSLRSNLPPVAQREYASLAAIARGDYDFYVTAWASDAARYGRPLLLRFAHEMNDPYRYPWGPQNGNRPDDFIAAWKHVHLIFQKMNATNVVWVWSPHISMPWFEYYYPGPEWVDWIGTGILNYGDVAPWSRWWTFQQILEKAYPTLQKLGKPIMITEFGSLTSGGDARQWYDQAFRDLHDKYSGVRSIIFFNQPHDVTLSTEPLNWSVLQSASATIRVRNELASHR
jgi:glycosyl hydrolase family 26